MNAHVVRKIRKLLSPFKRIGLKNKNFSIISNNCWGGVVYDTFGLEYKSPTIGLYFFADDFISFISDLKKYLSLEAKPISVNESRHKEELIRRGHYMIGIVGDVEIVFVHYKSAKDGCEKWNKRKERVNFDNMLLKFNDQNLFALEHLESFISLPYKNKLFFTSNKKMCIKKYCFFLKKYEKCGYAVDDIKSSRKICNYKKIINSML